MVDDVFDRKSKELQAPLTKRQMDTINIIQAALTPVFLHIWAGIGTDNTLRAELAGVFKYLYEKTLLVNEWGREYHTKVGRNEAA